MIGWKQSLLLNCCFYKVQWTEKDEKGRFVYSNFTRRFRCKYETRRSPTTDPVMHRIPIQPTFKNIFTHVHRHPHSVFPHIFLPHLSDLSLSLTFFPVSPLVFLRDQLVHTGSVASSGFEPIGVVFIVLTSQNLYWRHWEQSQGHPSRWRLPEREGKQNRTRRVVYLFNVECGLANRQGDGHEDEEKG